MDPSIGLPTQERRTATSSAARPWWATRAFRRLRAAAIAVGLFALVVFAADQVTSSPAVCASCHEMQVRAQAWNVSPHVRVKCVACHVSPRAWYAYPQTLLGRGRLLARDVGKHFSGGEIAAVDSRPPGVAPMSDAVCLRCHDPNRKPTAGLGILIDHPKHAKRNGSCVSCHITVAHPSATRGTALSFMAQCFTCHGTGKGAKAPATCTLCHPRDFQLKPASHKASSWQRGHGRVSQADRRQCEMCHVRSTCDKCHGLPMPHPKDWARNTGHPVYAQTQRQVCARCHQGKADWCTMCHHKAYDPAKGTWVKQHFYEVATKGAAYCLERCHSPVYCARCHVGASSSQRDGASGKREAATGG